MAYIGSSAAPIPVNFSAVQSQGFNGTGSQTAFTMARSVATPSAIEVLVNNVQQSPFDGSYTVVGTTLTFSEAPSTGTNNVYVIYRDQPVGSLIDTGAVRKSGDSMTNTLRLPGIETAGSPSLLFGASKWMTQYEGTLARTYICGPDSSNYAAWEIYRATATGSPILTMKLDSAGRVTTPYQPAFMARSGAASNTGPSGSLPFTDVQLNRGNHFNGSTGVFIAPVAGVYSFSAHILSRSSGYSYLHFRVNGVNFALCEDTGGASGFRETSGTCLVSLSAGDVVNVYSPSSTYGSIYDWFAGHLIG